MFCLSLKPLTRAAVHKQKTRDWLGHRGFSGNLFAGLEVSSHDAGAADATLPLGRLSIGAPPVQANCDHRSHLFLTRLLDTTPGILSKETWKKFSAVRL